MRLPDITTREEYAAARYVTESSGFDTEWLWIGTRWGLFGQANLAAEELAFQAPERHAESPYFVARINTTTRTERV